MTTSSLLTHNELIYEMQQNTWHLTQLNTKNIKLFFCGKTDASCQDVCVNRVGAIIKMYNFFLLSAALKKHCLELYFLGVAHL